MDKSTSKKKTRTVAEKITDLLLHPNDSSEEEQDEAPQVAEFDEYDVLEDRRSTDFRKRNVKLLSEQSVRYKGKISRRHDLDSDGSSLEEQITAVSEAVEEDSNVSEEDGTLEEESCDSDSNGDEEGDSGEEVLTNYQADLVNTNRQAEIQKGSCVQNQLRIWEKLLELRIQLQKGLNKANQLPTPAQFQRERNENEALESSAKECADSTSRLLASLLQLRAALSAQFPELAKATKRNAPGPLTNEAAAVPTKRLAMQLDQQLTTLRPYRNNVLLKWDDRTRLLTPGAGKNKATSEEYDIVRKIENVLVNRRTLVGNSQRAWAGQSTLVGDRADAAVRQTRDVETVNAEIYNDTDFYHQLLRELIEYKANTSSSMSEVTRQYVELQKLRQKMKKKVDTRASKGRKLRYVVHNKLVNFMAPNDTSKWSEDTKTELYKSLFTS